MKKTLQITSIILITASALAAVPARKPLERRESTRVPEPASIFLLASGVTTAVLASRKRQ